MDPDDELDDEGTSGPLLPPDDRLWRHPSELAAQAANPASPTDAAKAPDAPNGPNASHTGDAGHSRRTDDAARASKRRWNLAPRDNRMWTVAVLAGTVGAVLATGIGLVTGGIRTRTVPVPAVEKDLISPGVTLASVGSTSAFVAGAERVRPSVVSLVAHDAHGSIRTANGVVFRSDGMLLTAAHMVVGAQTVTATVGGIRRVAAWVIGSDAASDLAVLKLDGKGYEPAPLGSALDLQVGDPVIDVRPTKVPPPANDVPGDQASVGALGARLTSGTMHADDLLQVETSAPPSMVGGPLLDDHGAVVGIMTATGPSGKSFGFATPVDLAREIATQLLASGRVVPVWLGIEGSDLSSTNAKTMGVPGGAVVQKIYASSPASMAGLRSGDIVVGLDGRVITSMAVLVMALHARPPGTAVDLEVERGQGEELLRAVLEARPSDVD